MQRTVQIYVKDVDGNFQRLDLFKDENISITDKIQDVRDIAKVFTEFSQSFSVPASKTNNKLFKHYYNADIVDGPFWIHLDALALNWCDLNSLCLI